MVLFCKEPLQQIVGVGTLRRGKKHLEMHVVIWQSRLLIKWCSIYLAPKGEKDVLFWKYEDSICDQMEASFRQERNCQQSQWSKKTVNTICIMQTKIKIKADKRLQRWKFSGHLFPEPATSSGGVICIREMYRSLICLQIPTGFSKISSLSMPWSFKCRSMWIRDITVKYLQ